jgi:hypothetical protein
MVELPTLGCVWTRTVALSDGPPHDVWRLLDPLRVALLPDAAAPGSTALLTQPVTPVETRTCIQPFHDPSV